MLSINTLMDLLNNEMYFFSDDIANQELDGWLVLATWVVDQRLFGGGEGRMVKIIYAINPSPSPQVSSKYHQYFNDGTFLKT